MGVQTSPTPPPTSGTGTRSTWIRPNSRCHSGATTPPASSGDWRRSTGRPTCGRTSRSCSRLPTTLRASPRPAPTTTGSCGCGLPAFCASVQPRSGIRGCPSTSPRAPFRSPSAPSRRIRRRRSPAECPSTTSWSTASRTVFWCSCRSPRGTSRSRATRRMPRGRDLLPGRQMRVPKGHERHRPIVQARLEGPHRGVHGGGGRREGGLRRPVRIP